MYHKNPKECCNQLFQVKRTFLQINILFKWLCWYRLKEENYNGDYVCLWLKSKMYIFSRGLEHKGQQDPFIMCMKKFNTL